ncbi:MAG: hypothetical protein ABW095_08780, partial [Candidatus Thiodiazotropha sp.]
LRHVGFPVSPRDYRGLTASAFSLPWRSANDVERQFIDLLISCKDKSCRERIHTTVRNELQRTRRAVISNVDAVLKKEAEKQAKQQKKGFFGRFKK